MTNQIGILDNKLRQPKKNATFFFLKSNANTILSYLKYDKMNMINISGLVENMINCNMINILKVDNMIKCNMINFSDFFIILILKI